MVGKVVIYGGKGALGAAIVKHFKTQNWWVGSIDLAANNEADLSIVVNKDDDCAGQAAVVIAKLSETLKEGDKVDAFINVAGGWAGGNASADGFLGACDLMWKQSVWSSVITAQAAAKHVKEGGLITLPGAQPALNGTPGMMGYGMAKAAVHQLTQSLAGSNSGLPANVTSVALLPITLDTPMNRKWMSKADFSTWTPLDFVASTLEQWVKGEGRPASGSLVQLVTTGGKTELKVE